MRVVVEAKDGKEAIYGFDVKAGPEKSYLVERAGCKCFHHLGLPGLIIISRDHFCAVLAHTNSKNLDIVSPLGILKNPMILIAIASMGVVFGMPYLLENSELPRF